jgi:hypothetical protein
VERRRIVGALLVALSVLVFPLPSMCDQCRIVMGARNCGAIHQQGVEGVQATSIEKGEDCQHGGELERASLHDFLWASWPGGTCDQSLNESANMDLVASPPSLHISRAVVTADVRANYNLAIERHARHHHAQGPPPNPAAYQPLSVSLKI